MLEYQLIKVLQPGLYEGLVQGRPENIMMELLFLMVSIYSATLSWRCNIDSSPFMRAVYTILAFLFGLSYIFYYILIRVDTCKQVPGGDSIILNKLFR